MSSVNVLRQQSSREPPSRVIVRNNTSSSVGVNKENPTNMDFVNIVNQLSINSGSSFCKSNRRSPTLSESSNPNNSRAVKMVASKLRKKAEALANKGKSTKSIDPADSTDTAPSVQFYNNIVETKRHIFNNPELKQRAKSARSVREQNRIKNLVVDNSTTFSLYDGSDEWAEKLESQTFIKGIYPLDKLLTPKKYTSTVDTITGPFANEVRKNYSKSTSKLSRSNTNSGDLSIKKTFSKTTSSNNNMILKEEEEGNESNTDDSSQEEHDTENLHVIDNDEDDIFNDHDDGDEVIKHVGSLDHSSSVLIESSASLISSIYDGTPKESHYFGKEARYEFFGKFRKLSKHVDSLANATDDNVHDTVSHRRHSITQRRPSTAAARIPFDQSRVNKLSAIHQSSPTQKRETQHTQSDSKLENLNTHSDHEELKHLSPRTKFIQLLIKDPKKLAPLPIIIRHSIDDEELNLAHRALGDDYIIILSSVIADLPRLSKVNLRDNRLTDAGMGKFINILTTQSHITCVDLSENKIDSKSAEELTIFLRSPQCSLTILRLANADVDDDEAAIFMDAVEVNCSITELDMSHNKLGGVGEKNIANSTTHLSGGAAIAKALCNNKTLKSLDLSWNKLGISSALHLGNALRLNETLTILNLAYNRVRDEGAEAIGSALATNKNLTKLDLSYSGIGALGAIVIGVSLRFNPAIQYLNISGNPVGDAGGWALVQSLNYNSCPRQILLKECTFDSNVGDELINLSYPTGKHTIDLSKPRFRAMALELYRMASLKRGCVFGPIVHSIASTNKKSKLSKKTTINLVRPENPASSMGEPYGSWRQGKKRDPHPFTLMEADAWMSLERSLYLLNSATNTVWDVPTEGIITFEYLYVPRCATPIECLNATGLRRLIAIIQDHPKEYIKILKLCRNLILETSQLDEILQYIISSGRNKDIVDVFSSLMVCVRDTSNLNAIIEKYNEIIDNVKDVQISTRSLYYISVNAFTGHYALDLDNMYDRLAGIRLMELSADENEYIRHMMPQWGNGHGFTSQRQNRNNFRNEKYRRITMHAGVNDMYFCRGLEDKKPGLLEFDYVSIARPTDSAAPIHQVKLEQLLMANGLANACHVPTITLKRNRRRVNIVPVDTLDISDTMTPRDSHPIFQKLAVIVDGEQIHPKLKVQPVIQEIKSEEGNSNVLQTLGHFIVDMNHNISRNTSMETFRQSMLQNSNKVLHDLRPEDYDAIGADLINDHAMYFLGNVIDRYVVVLCIRIVNPHNENVFENIALIKKTSDGRYETFGNGESNKSPILEVLALENNENAKYEIGIVQNVIIDHINPTHKKYIINDDVLICGSEIMVRIKCSEWSPTVIENKAKEILSKIFQCQGINEMTIRLFHHRIADIKNEFVQPKFSAGVVTHTVAHQVDVIVEGLPMEERILLKSYMNTGRGATPDDVSALINTVWRWRLKTSSERIVPRVDLTTFAMEFWGFKLMRLRSIISSIWITCENAARIAWEFPVFGHDAQPHRETAIVILFSRIIDIENFELVLKTLPICSHCNVFNRIGWLNALNVNDCERLFVLNLEIEDNRMIMTMLAKFSTTEPGNNFINPRHRRANTDLFIPGWDLPSSWTVESDKAKQWDGVPRKGEVIVTYTASSTHGCKVVPSIRKFFYDKFMLHAVPRGNGADYHVKDTQQSDWNDMTGINFNT